MVHAAPELGDADLALDGKVVAPNAGYTDATQYWTLPPGREELTVQAPGSDEMALGMRSLPLTAGTATSAFVVGSGGERVKVVLVDDATAGSLGRTADRPRRARGQDRRRSQLGSGRRRGARGGRRDRAASPPARAALRARAERRPARVVRGLLVIAVPALLAGLAVVLLTAPDGSARRQRLDGRAARSAPMRSRGAHAGPGEARGSSGRATNGDGAPAAASNPLRRGSPSRGPGSRPRRRARGAARRAGRLGAQRAAPGRAREDRAHRPPRLAGRPGAVRGPRLARPRRRVQTIAHGARHTYRVTGTQQVPKTDFPATRVYASTDNSTLALITCEGAFEESTGYLDNLIVYAREVGACELADRCSAAGRRLPPRGLELAGARQSAIRSLVPSRSVLTSSHSWSSPTSGLPAMAGPPAPPERRCVKPRSTSLPPDAW